MTRTEVVGRLVLDEGVAVGRIVVEDDRIAAVEEDSAVPAADGGAPLITPGFVDVHVHG